jgi:hypothetical protein
VSIGTPLGPTSLETEVAAIMADVTTDISAATYTLGRKARASRTAPPVVQWMPVSEVPGPARKQAYPSGARSLATRVLTMRVECWADSLDDVDSLWASVLGALLRRYTPAVCKIAGAQWNTQDTSATELGELIAGTITLELAVVDRAPSTTATTSAAWTTPPITP